MRQKEQTDERDEFVSHLGMSPSSFILLGVKSPEGRGGSTITSKLENQAAEDLLGNSASVQQKLGNSLLLHICVS